MGSRRPCLTHPGATHVTRGRFGGAEPRNDGGRPRRPPRAPLVSLGVFQAPARLGVAERRAPASSVESRRRRPSRRAPDLDDGRSRVRSPGCSCATSTRIRRADARGGHHRAGTRRARAARPPLPGAQHGGDARRPDHDRRPLAADRQPGRPRDVPRAAHPGRRRAWRAPGTVRTERYGRMVKSDELRERREREGLAPDPLALRRERPARPPGGPAAAPGPRVARDRAHLVRRRAARR